MNNSSLPSQAAPGQIAPLHITPKGMADLLPPFAAERRDLARSLLDHVGLSGYELVTPPLFEHASVVELGNDLRTRDLLRFVEPETGAVAVLRPDITPQIARIVATHLQKERPGPYRLAYEGRVLRRPRGRARMHRQVAQVGVECIGVDSPAGDIETIALASHACEAVGLREFRVELCTSALVMPLLNSLPTAARPVIAELVASKDSTALRATAQQYDLQTDLIDHMEALIGLYGDLSVLDRAQSLVTWDSAPAALEELRVITDGLCRHGLRDHLRLDLGETRGLTYYTGVSFQVLAEGPGEAICSGGRYDNLLSSFGPPLPATGFAIYLDNLQWALRRIGVQYPTNRPLRVVIALPQHPGEATVVDAFRSRGIPAAVLPNAHGPDDALAFARSWSYDCAVVLDASGVHALRTRDGARRSLHDWFGAPSPASPSESPSVGTPTTAPDGSAIAALIQWASESK